MKDYFIKLFDYDRFANLQMLDCIIEAHEPVEAVGLMAHLLAAQIVWLKRCKHLPAPGSPVWPDWQNNTLKATIEDSYAEWTSFLKQTDDADFSNLIVYKNSKGDSFQNTLTEVLAHLINHGTHHRAQIGQQLKHSGLESLPASDYIFYLRAQKP